MFSLILHLLLAALAASAAVTPRSTDLFAGGVPPKGQVLCEGSHATNRYAGIPGYSAFGWRVYIPQPMGLPGGSGPDTGCGLPLLFRLREQSFACLTLTSWFCEPKFDGIFATFDTNIFCGAGQVQKAIWDSTSPQLENACANDDDNMEMGPCGNPHLDPAKGDC